MSRLIIVSNRVTPPVGGAQAGGLAVALQEALKSRGGIWFGWSGKQSAATELQLQRFGKVDYVTMDLTEKDYRDFYVDFCNSMLWPLFHYRMGITHFSRESFFGYERVNRLFAQQVGRLSQPDDSIWVHDYQLITTGAHMRAEGVKNRLGFFLHIPFPVPEVLSALPVAGDIIQALCAYDVVGFQTDADLQAFLRGVAEFSTGRKTRKMADGSYEVQAFGRKFVAGAFPIGIDTQDMMEAADLAATAPLTMRLKQSLVGRDMLIGVDRLDYTKGLEERVDAFNCLLDDYAEYRGKVTYLQITPTSRTDVEDYKTMRNSLEAKAARINGTRADFDWVPIRYVNKSFSRDALAGFYRTARVGLVTPLKDGMNLVAKEYVASQNPEDPGVLVLSQFAGAAKEMDAAVIINPYNPQATADQIAKALSMPLKERRERHELLMKVLHGNTIFTWTKNFLAQLQIPSNESIRLQPIIYPSLRVEMTPEHSVAM